MSPGDRVSIVLWCDGTAATDVRGTPLWAREGRVQVRPST